MGASDTEKRGYPKSLQKRDWTLYRYCGGGGAGGCPPYQGKTQVRFGVELHPFLVRQDSITLRNPEFLGIALYDNAGPDGFGCTTSYVLGTEKQWWLGFSNDGVLTDADVRAQNLLQTSVRPPFDIQVAGTKLPQPTDSDWSGTLYIHIHWADPNYVSDQVYADDIQYLRVVQHNYQVRH